MAVYFEWNGKKRPNGRIYWWAFRLLLLVLVAVAPVQAWATSTDISCSLFYEDFSGLSPYSWSYPSGSWITQNEQLEVTYIPIGELTVASTDFYASDLFRLDVDVQTVSAGGSDAAFGIYAFTSGDFFLDVSGRSVDGVAAYVSPYDGEAKLRAWDVMAGEWISSSAVSLPGTVTSVGLAYTTDAVTLRINGQDTAIRFSGDFNLAPSVLDTLWLMAGGTGAKYRFDNVCAEPVSSPPPSTGTYDGIWKDADPSMNFYIQTYTSGSAVVIATADLKDYYIFLDSDYSDGIDANDLGGKGHHLSLTFTSDTRASAVLAPAGAASKTYAISKSFEMAAQPIHDGIWKSPSCDSANMSYYVQSYAAGSGIVIATADLSKLYVFLDPDLSDGIDVDQYGGGITHLTLSLGSNSSGLPDTMARCFPAPDKTADSSGSASYQLTGMGSIPVDGVIYGPDGTSVTLAGETSSTGKTVSISTASAGDIVETGETSVSPAIRISVSGDEGPALGDGMFKVSIPLSATPTDPGKLTLKAKLSTDLILPVWGAYEASTNTYHAELAALYNGWVLGVVTDPDLTAYSDTEAAFTPTAWETDLNWGTHAYHVVDHTQALTDVNVREIQSAARSAGRTLDDSGFRAPKLWISTEENPNARIIHVVTGKIKFYQPGDEENANFTLASKTEQEMLALGRLYLDYNDIKTNLTPQGIHMKNVVIHELFHAVQAGYDVRFAWGGGTHSLKPYMEGTATPLGQSYQDNNGSIAGPEASVRDRQGKPEYALLDRAVDDYTRRNENADYYSKQDFFTYVARKYNSGNWAFLTSLFQALHNATSNQFGKTMPQYRALYRQAMHQAFTSLFGKGLPEIYAEYASDRAYRHSSDALLRSSENFTPNSLADDLFTGEGYKILYPEDKEKTFTIEPLAACALMIEVPEEFLTVTDSEFPLNFVISGADFSQDGLRITIFREDPNGVMVSSGGEIQVIDMSGPVKVTVNKDVPTLTILMINGHVDDHTATVKVSTQPATADVDYRLNFVASGKAPCMVTDFSSWSDSPPYTMTWNGAHFTGEKAATSLRYRHVIEGEVSGDRSHIVRLTVTAYALNDDSRVTTSFTAEIVPMVSEDSSGTYYEIAAEAFVGSLTSARAICGVDIEYVTPTSGSEDFFLSSLKVRLSR